jgi:hypothetical protein
MKQLFVAGVAFDGLERMLKETQHNLDQAATLAALEVLDS